MPTLDRLRVQKFRHVAPGTDLSFARDRNVILGQNGTGKTTLLKLISVVVRGNLTGIATEAFDMQWWITFSEARLHVLARNVREDREIPDEPEPNRRGGHATTLGTSYTLSYELRLETLTGEPLLEIRSGESPSVRIFGIERPKLRPQSTYELTRTLWLIFEDPPPGENSFRQSVFSVISEWTGLRSAYRFDEALGMYETISGPIADDGRGGAKKPMIRLERMKAGGATLGHDFVPLSLFAHFASKYFHAPSNSSNEHIPPLPTQDLSFGRADFSFLAQACDVLEFADCEMILALIKREAESQVERVTFGSPKFRFTKRDGSLIPDAYLSYGQKRLLSFAYYIDASRDVAIVDELVNGFHYRWISRCLDICAERQVFLTSQNPLLLDSLSFDSVDAAERTFITCRTELPAGELERAVWSNIDRRSAKAFHDALSVDFQSVSEILRAFGLW